MKSQSYAGDVRDMHREIQLLTGDDRGVQGETGAYSGTQGLCTGADREITGDDRERQRLVIRTGVSRGSSVNSINFITRGPAVITQTALSLVKVYCNKNQFLNKP